MVTIPVCALQVIQAISVLWEILKSKTCSLGISKPEVDIKEYVLTLGTAYAGAIGKSIGSTAASANALLKK